MRCACVTLRSMWSALKPCFKAPSTLPKDAADGNAVPGPLLRKLVAMLFNTEQAAMLCLLAGMLYCALLPCLMSLDGLCLLAPMPLFFPAVTVFQGHFYP